MSPPLNDAYTIEGAELQSITFTVEPEETAWSEKGAVTSKSQAIRSGIAFSLNRDNGWLKSFLYLFGRKISGEDIIMLKHENQGSTNEQISFVPPRASRILAIDLNETGRVHLQRGIFFAAKGAIDISLGIAVNLITVLFGEPIIMQTLKGNGVAAIASTGNVTEHTLNGDELKVDISLLLGYSEGITYKTGLAGSILAMMLGGEGLVMAKMSGHGKVWVKATTEQRQGS